MRDIDNIEEELKSLFAIEETAVKPIVAEFVATEGEEDVCEIVEIVEENVVELVIVDNVDNIEVDVEESDLENFFGIEEVKVNEIVVETPIVEGARNNNNALRQFRIPAPRFTPVIECFVYIFEPNFDGHLLTECYFSMVTLSPLKLAHTLRVRARCFKCFQKTGFGMAGHDSFTCKHRRLCSKHPEGGGLGATTKF